LFQLSKNLHTGAIASGPAFVPPPKEIVKRNLIDWERFFAKRPFATAIDLLGSSKVFCGGFEGFCTGLCPPLPAPQLFWGGKRE
jgi:hypothetical protein